MDQLTIRAFYIVPDLNCVLLNSVQELIEIEAWLLLIFLICFTQSINVYTFHFHILNGVDVRRM